MACTKYCVDVCPEVADGSRVIVSDSWTAQAEQILAARPDLVLASVPYQSRRGGRNPEGRSAISRPHTAHPLPTSTPTLPRLPESWALLKRARRSSAACKIASNRFANKLPVETKQRVFCEEWGNPIIASELWVAELVQVAGGEFIGQPGKPMTAEDIAAEQPDAIFAAWCGAGDRVPLEKIVEQRGWSELAAVRNGRVFCIQDELLNTPATTVLGGLDAIAWALHPERFPRPSGIRQLQVQ